ncbi:DUF4340 domain-containing protein, partial [Candidatus Sumerlaeota bacterium]|nr:DUF4340 domain-containing protein [Candidatus Sumerlaeota bacterium]
MTSMMWRKTYVSAIVFAVLLAICIGDHFLTKRVRESKELSKHIFAFKEDGVTSVTLVTPTEIISLEKTGKPEEWEMTQPIKTLADKDAVKSMVSDAISATRFGEFAVDQTIKLSDYGLDAPTHKLMLKVKDQPRELTLLVGKQSPESGKLYAKIETEEKIFSIYEYIKDRLDKKPFDLRDRTILAVSVDDVRRVVLARSIKLPVEIKATSEGATKSVPGFVTKAKEEIVVAKAPTGDWQMEKPVGWKGDTGEIENLVRKLDTEKVASFIDNPTTPSRFGFDTPQIAVQIEQLIQPTDKGTTATTQTQTLALTVGDRETSPSRNYYAKRGDGSIVTIGDSLFEALAVKATQLRSKQLFALASADIVRFEIETAKSNVHLSKNDQGRWLFADDAATTVDSQAVNEKVASLLGLRAKDFETDEPASLAQYKLDKPFVRLTVANKDNKRVESLEIGDVATRDNERVVFGRVGGLQSVVLLDVSAADNFDLPKDKFIDRSLFGFDVASVVEASVRQIGGTTFTLLRDGDTWKVQRAEDKEPRRIPNYMAEDVVRSVRDLKFYER